jgi:hypothetical protein
MLFNLPAILRPAGIALSAFALAACSGGGDTAEWSATVTVFDTDPAAESKSLILLSRLLLMSESGIDDLETFAPIAFSLDLGYSELDAYRSPLDFVFEADPGEDVRELVMRSGDEERRFALEPIDLSGTPPGVARPGAVFSWDYDADCQGEQTCELTAAGEAFGSAVRLLVWLEEADEVQVTIGDAEIAFTVPERPEDVAALVAVMTEPRDPDYDVAALYARLAEALERSPTSLDRTRRP